MAADGDTPRLETAADLRARLRDAHFTTFNTLNTIALSASTVLQAQAGVDLDEEAVNLIRYQQAFQASGRAMQVASDIFDTLLGIR